MVAERWTRPAEIAAEYEALPDEGARDYLETLQEASLEVVIIARRATENERLRDRIDSIVVGRAVPIINYSAVKWGKRPKWEHDEVKDVARFMFWKEILDGESFFEVRFWERCGNHCGASRGPGPRTSRTAAGSQRPRSRPCRLPKEQNGRSVLGDR